MALGVSWCDTLYQTVSYMGHSLRATCQPLAPAVDVNAKDRNENTALMRALHSQQMEVFMTLLQDPRIDLDARDAKGETARDIALTLWKKSCGKERAFYSEAFLAVLDQEYEQAYEKRKRREACCTRCGDVADKGCMWEICAVCKKYVCVACQVEHRGSPLCVKTHHKLM